MLERGLINASRLVRQFWATLFKGRGRYGPHVRDRRSQRPFLEHQWVALAASRTRDDLPEA